MNYGKLVLNAVLAGLWTTLGILAATDGALNRAVIWGAVVLGGRAALGLLLEALGQGVPVDK